MAKVLVVGAGAQGGPCARIIAGEAMVNEIRLGDIDFALANRVADKISGDQIQPVQVDASMKASIVDDASIEVKAFKSCPGTY